MNKIMTSNDINKIVDMVSSTKRNWSLLKGVLAALVLAFIFESRSPYPTTLRNYVELSLIFTTLMLVFLFMANKISTASRLHDINRALYSILNDDWSNLSINMTFCPDRILKHPVFICLIGLYACKYNLKSHGLALIEVAEKKLPLINMAIKNGEIIDKCIMEDIVQTINDELYPTYFLKTYNIILVINGLVGILLMLCLVIYLITRLW